MPKICVAYLLGDPSQKAPNTIARSSVGNVKKALKQYPATNWTIRTFRVGTGVSVLCALFESKFVDFLVDDVPDVCVKVTGSGQVRTEK